MKQFLLLLAPFIWSIKNDAVRFSGSFYRKVLFYIFSSAAFVYVMSKIMNTGIIKLQGLSADVFDILMIKGYSLIFLIIFFLQIISGFIISLNTFYQSKELDMLLISPVSRTSLFFSRIFITHLKASWMIIIFGIPLLVSSGVALGARFYYYICSLILFAVFSIISVNIGSGVAIFFSSFFHSRKIKTLFTSTGIIIAVLIVTLVRMLKPETFVNPEIFANITLFVSELKTSSFILLPNRWLSESLFSLLDKKYYNSLIFSGILFLTAYLSLPVLTVIFEKLHYKGWAKMQEGSLYGKERNIQGRILFTGLRKVTASIYDALTMWLNPVSRMIVKKDMTYQVRDIRNLYQILILLSLVVIYLFSIMSLPLNWEDIYYATTLRYTISFFNVGLILIIISALCSRIAYPSLVMEGLHLWLIKSSPITVRKYIWTKLLFYLLPIFFFGELLTVFSSHIIGINRTLFIINVLTTAFLTISLVSLALLFGISDMKTVAKDIEQEQLRSGNAVYMIISVVLILSTLACEAIPLYLYFLRELKQTVFTTETWLVIWIAAMILLIINSFTSAFSIRRSMKQFRRL